MKNRSSVDWPREFHADPCFSSSLRPGDPRKGEVGGETVNEKPEKVSLNSTGIVRGPRAMRVWLSGRCKEEGSQEYPSPFSCCWSGYPVAERAGTDR